MILGIAEDFTSNVTLDSELSTIGESGLFLNSGVHPCVTVNNLLSFLPVISFEIAAYNPATTYSKFSTSRNKKDLVTFNGEIYQSLFDDNVGEQPDGDLWLKTNLESLRLKSFVYTVQDRVLSDLNLTKHLINNQFIYEVGETKRPLPNDYCGWVFEPKGSDYVTIRINQVSIQKDGVSDINLYVVNQGVLVDTLIIKPSNGAVEFSKPRKAMAAPDTYTFKGKGKWMFLIDSTEVYSNNGWVDSLKYDGFTAYTCVGIGDAPETATYSYGSNSNGLGFNITAFLDSSLYVENNLNELGSYVRACFEYMTFQMYLGNANNRKNGAERIQNMGINLQAEITQNKDVNTSVSRYEAEKKAAIEKLNKTFDTQLLKKPSLSVSIGSV